MIFQNSIDKLSRGCGKINIKRIVIDGKQEELEFIVRIMCGVMMIAQLSSYKNIDNEGLIFLEANRK